MSDIKEITINENSELFNKKNLYYKEFYSDLKKVKIYTRLILGNNPLQFPESILLEQQICELISNGIKHGNKKNLNKKIKVWYLFTEEKAHIIIEDEGDGFKDIEKWNDFYKKRLEYINKRNFEKMKDFLLYKSNQDDESNGGNALFAALDYWNGGFVFNNKRNAVAALKIFQIKKGYKRSNIG